MPDSGASLMLRLSASDFRPQESVIVIRRHTAQIAHPERKSLIINRGPENSWGGATLGGTNGLLGYEMNRP
jgi:hypothetical protein